MSTELKKKYELPTLIFGGTAIVMLIAIGFFIWSIFQSSREGGRVTANIASRSALARFNPPAFRATSSPEAAQSPEFRAAVQLYTRTDYRAAIGQFAAALKAHPDLVDAHFYLGICDLSAGDRAAGIAELRSTIAAGPTPYVEQARYYLAKGLLASGDVAGARRQLEELIAMHGEMAQQADALLAQIK